MKFNYKFKTKQEKIAEKVYLILVENFSQTFFVGGTVRDMLLGKKLTDFDIATSAKPQEVLKVLNKYKIKSNSQHKNFGVIIAESGGIAIEITTFRKELYTHNRFPKISFVKSLREDAKRRDFTVNSLYFKPISNEVIDPVKGLADLKNKVLRFIGIPDKKINQDPLRILRAYRFAIDYGLKLDPKLETALVKNFSLLSKLSKNKINSEINKMKTKTFKKSLREIINKKT